MVKKLLTNASDTYSDNNLGNWIFGFAGNDKTYGLGGYDILDGGAGDDLLYGGSGNDALSGGDGKDKLFGDLGNDHLGGGDGGDRLDGGIGNDTIFGGTGNDVLIDRYGNNSLLGEHGDDILDARAPTGYGTFSTNVMTLDGGTGNDTLLGGNGRETMRGGAGQDTLDSGRNSDKLYGGAGIDTFYFGDGDGDGNDTIYDFNPNGEKIDLTGVVHSIDETFAITAVNSFDDLDVTSTASGTIVDYGTGQILLVGVAASQLSGSDFVFWQGDTIISG